MSGRLNKLFPDLKIIETNYFEVHQDWEVPIPGFFILAPKRKIRSIDEFVYEELVDYINLIHKVRKAMRVELNIDTVFFFQNEDTKHNYHLWIFPRYEWMKAFGGGINSVKPIMNYAIENMIDKSNIDDVHTCAAKLKKYISDKF